MKRPHVSLVAALSLGLAACPGGGGSGKKDDTIKNPPPTDDDTVQVSLADVGLEAASMDRSADPCTDFYRFSCGGWLDSNEIPADRARWGRFAEIDERNEKVLHEILEDARAGKGGDDPIMKKLGDFYGSCMDEEGIEKAGMTGVRPLLDKIKKVKDGKTLMPAVIALHNAGVDVAFGAGSEGDFLDSTMNVLWIDSSGLGLPDRDYYFEKDFEAKVTAYHDHLVRVFGLLGRDAKKSQAAADNVLAIEKQLAEKTKTAAERRDLPKLYNPLDPKALGKLTPHWKWQTYLQGRGNADHAKIIVTTPEFLEQFDAMLGKVKGPAWQDYLTARLVDDLAFALPRKFDEERFALERVLSGVEEQRERYKRCVEAVDHAMPEALGQPYIERMFPGESKQAAIETVQAIATAFGLQMATLDWMSPATKDAAKAKLAKISGLIGYPDTWREYDFAVAPDNFGANTLAAAAFEVRRQFLKAGKPYDRDEWLMPAYIVNAYYNPIANNTALPAGILQRPFFAAERMIHVNLGGVGFVVGHELTHGFDDQGAQFDAEGNMKMWWQPADFEQFQAKGQCVAEQYSTFEVLPGKFVDGNLTLGENIADLGGVKNAFYAARAARANVAKKTVAEGLTEDQQFFVAAAQVWCTKDRPEEAERRLTVDPHSPPMWRVNGVMRNTPEFAEAFQCKTGSKMRAAKMCSVW